MKLKKGIRNFLIIFLSIIIIGGISYIIKELFNFHMDKKQYEEIKEVFHSRKEVNKPEEKVDKVANLKEIHNEYPNVYAWLEIPDTNINYPVMQYSDNDFYLTHNYKNEKSSAGAIYFDKDVSLTKPSDNYQIYGHRNKYGLMFESLLKYAKKDFYDEHHYIYLTTLEEESTYEIVAVFYSRVYYSDEVNVFRYYNFVNANNVEEFNSYIQNAKSASIYDTGVEVSYHEQIITLSTCEYSKENGRFVVVAKKVNI